MYGKEWLEEREIGAATVTVLAALDAVPAQYREEVRRRVAPAPPVMQAQLAEAMRQQPALMMNTYPLNNPYAPMRRSSWESLFGFQL